MFAVGLPIANFTSQWLPIRLISGFLGRFPAQEADEPSCKFNAASFILGREIRNRANTQNYKKKTNKQ